MTETLASVTVDFSNSDEAGLTFARLERASRPVMEGEQVVALDGEGHECHARVARIEGALVYLELDRSTWVGPAVTTPAQTIGVAYSGSSFGLIAQAVSEASADERSSSANLVSPR